MQHAASAAGTTRPCAISMLQCYVVISAPAGHTAVGQLFASCTLNSAPGRSAGVQGLTQYQDASIAVCQAAATTRNCCAADRQ